MKHSIREHMRPPGATAEAAPRLSRRQLLTGAAVAGGAVAVLGCSVPILARTSDGAAEGEPTTTTNPTTVAAAEPVTSATAASATGAATAEDIFADVSSEHLEITTAAGVRTIRTASYPDWPIDATFRYPGTPSPQDLVYAVTATPTVAASPTQVVTGQVFGVHRNGVVFDPTTAGYFGNQRNGDWNDNALASMLDSHGCHTRPDGFYHAHLITDAWVSDPTVHSPFVGWAADGFPIYLRYGYVDPTDRGSGVRNLASSYRLKAGNRPTGSTSPGGTYDGTYVADYEYVDGLGDLDECNGRSCVTPEFPEGTYAYFLTDAWPSVPHWIRGTPDPSFRPGFGGGSGPSGAPT